MLFSEMWSRVAIVIIEVLDELIASIIKVKSISELGTTLAVTVPTKVTRRHIPEDGILDSYSREDIKSYKSDIFWEWCTVSQGEVDDTW
jgi:hypothetical protein